MSVVQAISNWFSALLNWFSDLIRNIVSIWQSIINIISYWLWIVKALRYWMISLCSWIRQLILQAFNSWVFVNVAKAFSELTNYIWAPAVIFIATLFLFVLVRIAIAFVFKLLRLNIDYHTLNSQTRRWSQKDDMQNSKLK